MQARTAQKATAAASPGRKSPASRTRSPRWRALVPAGLAEAAGPFSRAVHVDKLLWIAGTTALSHISGDYYERKVPRGIEAQTRLTLDNIRKTVEAAGGQMHDIFKVVIMLKNPRDYRKMNAVRAEYFRDHPPISTCFRAEVMRADILVEIEAVAALR
jgi:enamine deaminase RidA (YjgF/YER057c/UK114 family)